MRRAPPDAAAGPQPLWAARARPPRARATCGAPRRRSSTRSTSSRTARTRGRRPAHGGAARPSCCRASAACTPSPTRDRRRCATSASAAPRCCGPGAARSSFQAPRRRGRHPRRRGDAVGGGRCSRSARRCWPATASCWRPRSRPPAAPARVGREPRRPAGAGCCRSCPRRRPPRRSRPHAIGSWTPARPASRARCSCSTARRWTGRSAARAWAAFARGGRGPAPSAAPSSSRDRGRAPARARCRARRLRVGDPATRRPGRSARLRRPGRRGRRHGRARPWQPAPCSCAAGRCGWPARRRVLRAGRAAGVPPDARILREPRPGPGARGRRGGRGGRRDRASPNAAPRPPRCRSGPATARHGERVARSARRRATWVNEHGIAVSGGAGPARTPHRGAPAGVAADPPPVAPAGSPTTRRWCARRTAAARLVHGRESERLARHARGRAGPRPRRRPPRPRGSSTGNAPSSSPLELLPGCALCSSRPPPRSRSASPCPPGPRRRG